MISSQVLDTTLDGGGSVAPALRQMISHTSKASAMTTRGGTTRAAMPLAAAMIRVRSAPRLAIASGKIVAIRGEGGAAVSVLNIGMFILGSLRWVLAGRPATWQAGTRLIDRRLTEASGG